MEWSLTGLPLPIVIRPPSPLSDDQIIAFSRSNKPYRVEVDAAGDLHVVAPMTVESAQRNTRVASLLSRGPMKRVVLGWVGTLDFV